MRNLIRVTSVLAIAMLCGAGQANSPIPMSALATGTITGTVKDKDGKPVEKYAVKLLVRVGMAAPSRSANSLQENPSPFKVVGTSNTDAEGKFKFTGLKKGVYFVSDTGALGEKAIEKVRLADGETATTNLTLP